MTRETDGTDVPHLELGHVYDRLKKLEDGQHEMQTTLQAVQLKMTEVAAAGHRFPNWLPQLLGSILVVLVVQSAGAIWWASGVNSEVVSFQQVRNDCRNVDVLTERLNALSEKVVGKTDKGWHRPDHDQYAQYVEERFKRLEQLIEAKR